MAPTVASRSVWAIGVLAGLVVAGWTFSGDLLLNWDQVIGRRIPIPPGFWGLGPELPRRVPFYVPFALFSRIFPGPAVVGAFLVLTTASAIVGVHRLAGRDVAALTVGLGYGLSPFLLTRAAVGHLPLVAATALLPWAMPAFERANRKNVLWWAALFGLTGSSGAVIGLVPALIALMTGPVGVAERLRRILMLGLTQITWIVPGLVVLNGGASFPTTAASAFATQVRDVGGLGRLFAGGGFFIGSEDVAGRSGWAASVLGLSMLVVGTIGLASRKRFDRVVQSSLVGLGLVVVSAIPGVAGGWNTITGIGPFGVVRESQKFWPLIAIALGVGVARVLRAGPTKRHATPGAVAAGLLVVLQFVVAWPGLFGADGRLEAVAAPVGWREVEQNLEVEPGTTVVFPWRRYDRLTLSQGRNVLQPGPWTLPGNVLISSDPDIGRASSERNEPLQNRLEDLDLAVRAGASIAPALSALGVDWLLVSGSEEAALYRRLGREPEVTVAVDAGPILLFRLINADHDLGDETLDATAIGTGAEWSFLGVLASVGAIVMIVTWLISTRFLLSATDQIDSLASFLRRQ